MCMSVVGCGGNLCFVVPALYQRRCLGKETGSWAVLVGVREVWEAQSEEDFGTSSWWLKSHADGELKKR
jgi:hypothetical protein